MNSHRSIIAGRLCITTTEQAVGAPIVDGCFTRDAKGNQYVGRCILLWPWKKNQFGERSGRAIVFAWRRGAYVC